MFSHDYKLEEIRFIELIIKFLWHIRKAFVRCYLCVLASDSIRTVKTFCSSFLNGFHKTQNRSILAEYSFRTDYTYCTTYMRYLYTPMSRL